jgi:hypothetical protein
MPKINNPSVNIFESSRSLLAHNFSIVTRAEVHSYLLLHVYCKQISMGEKLEAMSAAFFCSNSHPSNSHSASHQGEDETVEAIPRFAQIQFLFLTFLQYSEGSENFLF